MCLLLNILLFNLVFNVERRRECQVCGTVESFPFICSYCGEVFCSTHRLPENHQCPGLRREASEFRVEFKPLIYERPPIVKWLTTFHFSKTELKHLGVAMLIVGLIFSWGKNLTVIPPIVVAVLLGFIIHEVAHKIAAQKHGLQAEFRINPMLALISLISIALPVRFVAPGAVVIWGPYITRRIEAEISSAGPLTNIVIAFIGLAVNFIKALSTYGLYILMINSFLALFNLLPLPMFDGGKLFRSDLRIWLILLLLSLVLFMFSVL